MLRIENLRFGIAGRPLFEGASAVIPAGHKVGLVGRNGTGKTTLFRLIREELSPEGGSISLTRGTRIGGVAQEVPAGPTSLLDTVLAADTERAALLAEADTATDPTRIAEIQIRLADIDAHSAEARAATILAGLGFDSAAQGRACADFSGGWRMRVALAAVLFSAPDLLLLDEPTNYLDLEGTLWLESYLARYPHTVLLISHDRQILNRAVGAILHLEAHKLTLYQGSFDTFARMRAERAAQAATQAKKQAATRARMQSFIDRFRYKASKARQAQSRIKALERMTPIAELIETQVAGFAFPDPEDLSPPIIRLEDVAVGYDGPPVLRGLNLRIDQDDRIALLGANGQGKSTFSKLISGRLTPVSGQIHAARKLRIGYFAQHQVDELVLAETPLDHLRRARPDTAPAKLRAMLAGGGIGAEIAETPVQKLSGGQKARLALLLATLDAPHLIILDEPTNHLDIESREALVQGLTAYGGAVILVSHDPHLIDLIADRLWLVKDGAVRAYDGDLDGYARQILGTPDRMRTRPAAKKPPPSPKREDLQADLRKCETRLEKLEEMRAALDRRLADPTLYDGAHDEMVRLQQKRAEVEAGLARAEALWTAAVDRLDAAGGA
ncbi:MAG: ABC-F family ATP-binding cassette domain-containing protein [Pseudomonadota bacterium]